MKRSQKNVFRYCISPLVGDTGRPVGIVPLASLEFTPLIEPPFVGSAYSTRSVLPTGSVSSSHCVYSLALLMLPYGVVIVVTMPLPSYPYDDSMPSVSVIEHSLPPEHVSEPTAEYPSVAE